jgi:hypothetical protein
MLTEMQARDKGLIQHLVRSKPERPIHTQWGHILYYEWLEMEKDRIEQDKTRTAEIVGRLNGEVSLWVNPVA